MSAHDRPQAAPEPEPQPDDLRGLLVDDVVAFPSDFGTLVVEVSGRWLGPAPPALGPPALIVDDGRRSHRFPALPAGARRPPPTPRTSGFAATFSVPADLRSCLVAPLALELASARVALPDARQASAPRSTNPGAVVDPLVLAERRALRAEHGERAVARAAAESERELRALRATVTELRARLAAASEAQERLEALAAESEAAAAAAGRRAESERRRREELAAEVVEWDHAAREAAAASREAADEAWRALEELAVGRDELERRAAEGEQIAAVADARVAAAEDEAGELRAELSALRSATREDAERRDAREADLESRLASAEETIERERVVARELADSCAALRRELEEQSRLTDQARELARRRTGLRRRVRPPA